MKIAIRADGGNSIGMGHIMRTMVLAEELSKENEVFYICRNNNEIRRKFQAGIDKLKSKGFRVLTIDENNLLEGMKNISAECIITDSYDVDEAYFDTIKSLFKYSGYIDDNDILSYYNVDFLINQNIYAKELKYRVNEDTKLFLGTDYVLLREEFRRAPIKIIKEEIKNVLVTVGGSDNNNLTEKILKSIHKLKYKFHVVIGPAFKNPVELKEIYKSNQNIELYYDVDMFKLMEICDIAISTCGSTLYELCACGVPTIGIVVANNQNRTADSMNKLGVINNLGWYEKISSINMIKILENMNNNYQERVEMSLRQTQIVNKSGATLLSNYLNKDFMHKC